MAQQRPAFVVVGCRGDERDVHAAYPVDPVLIDLVEHDLLVEAKGVVALAVELFGREAAEDGDALVAAPVSAAGPQTPTSAFHAA